MLTMCDVCCGKKIAELVKKHKLKKMLSGGFTDMLNNKIDTQKIVDFVENKDCCKVCKITKEI